jgi:hypothetical protein
MHAMRASHCAHNVLERGDVCRDFLGVKWSQVQILSARHCQPDTLSARHCQPDAAQTVFSPLTDTLKKGLDPNSYPN